MTEHSHASIPSHSGISSSLRVPYFSSTTMAGSHPLNLDSIPEHPASSACSTPPSEHLHYLSNLKVFLTALVILHHTAIAYGGQGSTAYNSPSHPQGSEPALVAFNAVNQTFFVAMFFFIAGFLSKRSLERKGGGGEGLWGFVRGRCWRLCVPTLVYSLFAPGLCQVMVELAKGTEVGWWTIMVEDWHGIRGVRGPVWFCALLLLFDLGLAGWCGLQTRAIALPASESPTEDGAVNDVKLCAALALLTTFDFFWRIYFPVGKIFVPLNLNMAYLPQYIVAYIFGTRGRSPLHAVANRAAMGPIVAWSALSSIVLMRDLLAGNGPEDPGDGSTGGINILAAAYAVWNNSMGYILGRGLLFAFHQHGDYEAKAISKLAYTAFLIHMPVSTGIEVASEGCLAGALLNTAVVGTSNIFASWTLAWLCEAGLSSWRAIVRQVHDSCVKINRNKKRRSLRKGHGSEILEGLDDVGI